MKLTELKPRWITLQNWRSPDLFAIGLSFICPHCSAELNEHGKIRRRRLAVSFWPPVDPHDWMNRMAIPLPRPPKAHDRTGDTFDTLTLTPSIGFESIGHWHGFITNGECHL